MAATARERAADYHQDLGDRPTLSSTIAATLILKTPAHAKARHPRLTDHPAVEGSYSMNLGTTVHQMLLHDDRVVVVPYNDFRSKDAQEERDAALAQGKVPVTQRMWDDAMMIALAVSANLAKRDIDPRPFTQGQAEHVIRYLDRGAECRAMLDWLRDDRDVIDDLKTTTDASPGKVRRHIFNMGYDIRAAFYVRAVENAYRVTPRFRWVFVETKPPYPVTVATLTDRALESARIKVDEAINTWKECLAKDNWPAYQPHELEVDLPGWMVDAADRWGEVDVEESVPF